MNIGKFLRTARARRAGFLVATVFTLLAVAVIARSIDAASVVSAVERAGQEPVSVVLAVAAFGMAFVLRAVSWQRVLPGLSYGQALGAIHVALGANHVLPLRLGEPLRIVSAARRTDLDVAALTASTVTLRAADMAAVVTLGVIVAPAAFFDLVGPLGLVFLAILVGAAALGLRWMWSLARQSGRRAGSVRLPGFSTLALALGAWVCESILVLEAAGWAGLGLTWSEAMLVTSVAIAAQVGAIAPGGFGTYEAAAVAAFVSLGYDARQALVAALAAHGLKTAYSLIAGLIGLVVPGPGLLGRFRLRSDHRPGDHRPGDHRPGDHRPGGNRLSVTGGANGTRGPAGESIFLFMPAFNEEASVGATVRRAPNLVGGHPVDVVVIDDGSTDNTAIEATRAGAEVISMGQNRGLGAAVRRGLHEGAARGAGAIVFCDADGEYPPEELAKLVEPIFDGQADYVVGSRFAGHIEHMHPHRRVGNLVLTAFLSFAARRRISDGQSGYRAFSSQAAADAELIHDFNYAQVLTLDLLAKGYRYGEVPISYRFRTEGESFIKLGPYLRNVVPAVYRQLNAYQKPRPTLEG